MTWIPRDSWGYLTHDSGPDPLAHADTNDVGRAAPGVQHTRRNSSRRTRPSRQARPAPTPLAPGEGGRSIYDNSRRYNEDMLDVLDHQLADAGYELIRYRKEFTEMLSSEAGEIMKKISGGREELRIEYKTSCFENPVKRWILSCDCLSCK